MTLPTQQVGHCLHTSIVDAGVLRRLHVIPQQLQGIVVKHGAFLNCLKTTRHLLCFVKYLKSPSIQKCVFLHCVE